MENINRDLDLDLVQDQGNNHLEHLEKDPCPDHLLQNRKFQRVQSQERHQVRDKDHALDHAQNLAQENRFQDQNRDRCQDHEKDHSLLIQEKVLDQDLVRDLLNLDLDLVPAQKRHVLDHVQDPDQNQDQDQNHVQSRDHIQNQNHVQDLIQVHDQNQGHVLNRDRDRDQDQAQQLDLDIPPDLNLVQDQDLAQHQNQKDQEAVAKILKALSEKEIEFYPIPKKKTTGLKQPKNQNMDYQTRKTKVMMK